MAESDEAIKLANRLLDESNTDPDEWTDDSLRVLARQLLRERERYLELGQTLRKSALGLADAGNMIIRFSRKLEAIEAIINKYASDHSYHDMNFADVMEIAKVLR